jgi:hypothetical protein
MSFEKLIVFFETFFGFFHSFQFFENNTCYKSGKNIACNFLDFVVKNHEVFNCWFRQYWNRICQYKA